jgi:hypothetical protein
VNGLFGERNNRLRIGTNEGVTSQKKFLRGDNSALRFSYSPFALKKREKLIEQFFNKLLR